MLRHAKTADFPTRRFRRYIYKYIYRSFFLLLDTPSVITRSSDFPSRARRPTEDASLGGRNRKRAAQITGIAIRREAAWAGLQIPG